MLKDKLVQFSFGLHYRFAEWLEAREIEMGDQLARLLANNVSKNAEIQNLNFMVQERVEVYLTFNFMPALGWLCRFFTVNSCFV